MQSPENERRRMLNIAIDRATEELGAPINSAKVKGDYVICRSGLRKVVMSYQFSQGGEIDRESGRFIPNPGSGRWTVIVVDRPEGFGLWSRLAKVLTGR